ncbi:MAG: hypothetical protein ACE5HS_22030 [bacterium]
MTHAVSTLTGSVFISFLKSMPLMVIPILFGFGIARRIDGVFFIGERWLLGAVIGLTIVTAVSFLFSFALIFEWYIIVAVLLCLGVAAVKLLRTPAPAFKISQVDKYALLVFILSLTFFALLSKRIILWQDGALVTGFLDAWGDLPLHISLIMSFTADTSLALKNTIFAGKPLVYPFMSDFFSALLMRLNLPLEAAIEWPTVLFNSLTLTLLFYLSYRLVRNRNAALLTPLLFVLAGGLGFWWFFKDLYFAPKPIWEFLQHLPQRYTNLSEQNIRWVNPLLAHLIPQRSFLFGLPIGLMVILLWWNDLRRLKPRAGWLTGGLVGVLPLFHAHTFFSLLIVAAVLFLFSIMRKKTRSAHGKYWLFFGISVFVLAAPQLGFLLSAGLSRNVFRFHLGWMAESDNVFWFYLKNFGLFIPLTLIALLMWKRLKIRKQALRFYVPFALLFIICNLFLFAPFAYDNNKILIYWFLLSLPFMAKLLVTLFNSRSWWMRAPLLRSLFVGLILSGSLNLLHEFQSGGWQELSAEEVELSQQVRQETDSRAVFLSAPVHNNLLSLAGRTVVMGYPGHVYSHGLDYTVVEKEIGEIYTGGKAAQEYLQKFSVDYVVVGPHERQKYGESTEWFKNHYPPFMQTVNYFIFKITSSAPLSGSANTTSKMVEYK